MACSPFEETIRYLSLDVFRAFRVREKAFNLNFSPFLPQKRENPRRGRMM